jgi:TolA-binding protein
MTKRLTENSARLPRARLWLALAAAPLAPGLAAAGPIDDANRRLADIEERTRHLTTQFREQTKPDPNAAERRLVEAQAYYELKNYEVAATLALDIIDRHPGSRVHDDALLLLGESLFRNKDYLSARRYFLDAAKKRNGSRVEQEALQRLVEIALRSGDYDGIEGILERLGQIPPAQLQPSVPYVRAKYMYFRNRDDEALRIFSELGPTNAYYLQARYFLATLQVKKGNLAAAASAYEEVLRQQPRNESDRDVQDLARLAIGRIYYDRGQFDRARDTYNGVSIGSKYSAEARYESAWNAIRSKDYKAAYRSLDLMLLQNPDSPRAPELRLLMGNLNLRMSNFFVANETFDKTRDQVEPIYRQLLTSYEKSKTDPSYFEGLLGKGLERFDIALFVPGPAIKWVQAEPDVARMLNLAGDVGELQRGIRDSEKLLASLERAVNGQGRVGLFSDLASARLRSTELLNQTIDLRRRFLPEARRLALSFLAPDERAELERLEEERRRLERDLADLPLSESALRKREGSFRDHLQALDAEASRQNVLIQSMEAELVAIEQYYVRSAADQKIRPEDLQGPVTDLKTEIATLRAGLDTLRTNIADATRDASFAGAAYASERSQSSRLGELLKQEHELLVRARGRMTSNQEPFDRTSFVLRRADDVYTRLSEFDRRLEDAAERRLQDVRGTLVAEKAQLEQASSRLTSVLSESQTVGGGLAQTMLGRITDRFYDLTVQSDVGLIDVSWGLKDQRTGNLSKLINQQKLELQSIEDDFRSLLEEEK